MDVCSVELIMKQISIYEKKVLKKEDRNNLLKKFSLLKLKIKKLNDKYTWFIYKLLLDAYRIGKKLNHRYTYKDLEEDFDIEHYLVTRIMALTKANEKTWKLIKNNKISLDKVSYILRRHRAKRQNEIIPIAIKNNLTLKQIYKLFREGTPEEVMLARTNLAIENNFHESYTAWRSLNNAILRIRKCLLIKIDKLPKKKQPLIIKDLKKLNKELEKKIGNYD